MPGNQDYKKLLHYSLLCRNTYRIRKHFGGLSGVLIMLFALISLLCINTLDIPVDIAAYKIPLTQAASLTSKRLIQKKPASLNIEPNPIRKAKSNLGDRSINVTTLIEKQLAESIIEYGQ